MVALEVAAGRNARRSVCQFLPVGLWLEGTEVRGGEVRQCSETYHFCGCLEASDLQSLLARLRQTSVKWASCQ